MKKIMIVGPGISMGGVERSSVNISNGLSTLGYRVTYHALFPHNEFFALNPEIRYEKPTNGLNKKSISILATIRRIRCSVSEDQPDVVIAFSKFYAALTAVALFGFNTRFIISERSSPHYNWGIKISVFNRFAFSMRKPDAVFAQTNAAAAIQKKYYGSRTAIDVIPNPVKHIELHPEITRSPIILAVGRMNDPLKGFDRLVRAMTLVSSPWELHIAGGSEEEGIEIVDLARALNISSKIKFVGKVRDIDRLYAKAGIFVIPSRSEGFPNALVEAMAAGLPCISFDFSAGPSEIITHEKDGVLVPNGDIEGLACAIDSLIRDEKKRLSIAQHALAARERFSVNNILLRLKKIVEDER